MWACEKFSRYLVGLSEFKLLTDHRPLVPLMNSRSIDDTPIRCQRLLMRAMRYNPIVEYVPGKLLVIADALSRKPLEVREPQKDDIELSEDLTRFNKIATQGAPQMAVDKEANSLSRVYSYYSKFNLRLFYV